MPSKSTSLALLATSAIVAISGPAAAGIGSSASKTTDPKAKPDAAQLAKVRKATLKYRDVRKAIADGYMKTDKCHAEPGGAMGFHYVHKTRVLDREVDATKPEVLLYGPKKGGGVQLNGVEYFVVDADQKLSTRDKDLPKPLGHAFDGPMAGHEPGMPVHNDLHVWLYAKNPKGLFAPLNPKVKC